MIVGAAIKVGDKVYTAPPGGGICKHSKLLGAGTRHCCVYQNNHEIYERTRDGKELSEQGFVLEDGTFLTRTEAGVYAFEHGQITERVKDDFLFSEDLWYGTEAFDAGAEALDRR